MQVVALVSQKGGTGKTTLAAGLAVSGERAGLSTVLVDLDPQASAAKWGDLRDAETPVVTTAPATRIARVLDASRAAGAALAILDTAPHSAEATLAAARASGLVLIPCRASTADLHAIAASVDLVRIAGARAAAVLNAAPVQGPLADEALAALAGYDLAAAPVVMHQRIAHVYAFTVGLTAAELEPAGDVMGVRDETPVYMPKMTGAQYEKRVEDFLRNHLDHIVIHRLRNNQPLTTTDLQGLETTLTEIGEEDGQTLFAGLLARSEAPSLAHFVRSLAGMDRVAAQEAFSGFLSDRSLTPPQIRFIEMVIDQLVARGVMEASALYEPPFSNLHAGGPDELFVGQENVIEGIFDKLKAVHSNVDHEDSVRREA